MEVFSQKKNSLMRREEAWIRLDHAGKPTPPRKDIIADIAKHFKAKEDSVIVDKIFSEFGKPSSRVKVLVYSKAEEIPKAKLEKMKIRMGLMEKPKKGGQTGPPAPTPASTGDAKAGEAAPTDVRKKESETGKEAHKDQPKAEEIISKEADKEKQE